ncbi:MAG: CBS domain-containing protein [Deltaproteobacteria bacterium]|nr:CBS domain-containing protein [Deltaproteobacteria bacterium]
MPYSVPVSKLMIKPGEWPILPAEADVESAIKVLRIVNEEKKLQHGHSTPLVLDSEYNVIGFVHLLDLLREIRPLCETQDAPCEPRKATRPVRDLVVSFAGAVEPTDPILKALDIMMEHKVSLVPVLVNNKLEGVVKLSDIFNTVASILFDEEIVDQKEVLMRRFHL